MHAFTLNEKTGFYDDNYSVTGDDIIAMADRLLVERLARPSAECFQNPVDIKTFLKLRLAPYKFEVFSICFLDNRHRLLSFDEMFQGTIDGASVHPREVVRSALEHNAATFILTHNHPSGVAEPSRSDIQLTRQLSDSLALIDVRVIDHRRWGR